MKRKIKVFISIIVISFYNVAFSQTKDTKNNPKPKTKKQEYIENYITNFPYKNSDIYPVICNVALWDTTGDVPVIDINTIMMNMDRRMEKK